ncbi:MAG: T9SS type A sorting domain-containing protein, partial [Saprospiraceae bacterium]|nr:T9SS type A sorting domain-containing protein [Saprospiraceae bacterium]
PYTYLWSNGATTQNISDVPAGIYSCIITDAVGATTTAVANIQQPSQLIVSLSNQMEINCFHSGAASIQIEGGVPPYAVFWSNGLSNTQTATFTTPGWYTYSVYDQHQCLSNLGTVIITSDTLVPILQATGGNVNCQNAPVTLQAITDGTNATFTWSGPNGFTSIQQNPTTTTCGEYSVTVTTPNGCSSTTAVSVSCEAISNIEINTQNISCDGILHVVATAVGGQPPYDYSWMGVTNIDGNNADVASGSTYGVSVTDMAGCFYQISPLTHSFVPLSATAVVTNESSPDAADGAVELFVTGGVAPYSFSGSALSNLPADEYAITITDAQGCAYIVNFIVGTTLGAEDVFNDNSITISPNPNTGEFILNTMLYQNNAVVNIFNTMGQLVFVKTLSNQNNPISISHLPKGVYWLVTNTEQKKKIIKKLLIQ